MPAEPRWMFLPRRPDDLANEDQSVEMFQSDDVVRLVREAIQNSLDAASSSTPITVRFAFGSVGMRDAAAQPFLRGLAQSLLDKPNERFRSVFEEPISTVLVVEDFGTVGLTGDTTLFVDPPDTDTTQRFYYFWRSRGRGKRDTGRRGRWGLGKKVFGLSSRLSTFFGLTRRDGDTSPHLMGFSELKVHRVDGITKVPTGYFGQDGSIPDSTVPIHDTSVCKQFASVFGVKRNNEAGLSIVIPYVQETITPSSIRRAVLDEYYLALLKGELVVKIESAPGESEMLDGGAVRKWSETDAEPRTRAIVKLAMDYVDGNSSDAIVIRVNQIGKAPVWSGESIADDVKQMLVDRWRADGNLRLRLLVDVAYKAGNVAASEMHLMLAKAPAIGASAPVFIRESLRIPSASSSSIEDAVALVVVEEGDLGKFLGDAENPAHTEWRPKGLAQKYLFAGGTLEFVQLAPFELWQMIVGRRQPDITISLKDVFGLDIQETGSDGPGTRGQKKGKHTGRPDVPNKRPRRYRLTQTRDGFRLTNSDDGTATYVGSEITVKVAYAVRHGSGFAKWKPADFKLEAPPISTKHSGVTILSNAGKVLRFRIERIPYEVEMSGFDTNRDLEIKVD